MHKRLP